MRFRRGAISATRDADEDQQWAYAWLALLLVVPFLWLHYLWVAFAVLGLVVARCREPDRWLPALPIAAAVCLPLAVLNPRGTSMPVVQAVLLLAILGFTGWLLRARSPGRTAGVLQVR